MFLNLGQSSYAQVKEVQETSIQNANFPSHTTCTLIYNEDEGDSYWGIKAKSDSGFSKGFLFFK